MSRRAATAWFSKLADVSVEIIHDFDHVDNVDLLAIEFHDSNYNGHLEVIERLQPQVKKFLVVESEPTTTQYQGFIEYLDIF